MKPIQETLSEAVLTLLRSKDVKTSGDIEHIKALEQYLVSIMTEDNQKRGEYK